GLARAGEQRLLHLDNKHALFSAPAHARFLSVAHRRLIVRASAVEEPRHQRTQLALRLILNAEDPVLDLTHPEPRRLGAGSELAHALAHVRVQLGQKAARPLGRKEARIELMERANELRAKLAQQTLRRALG